MANMNCTNLNEIMNLEVCSPCSPASWQVNEDRVDLQALAGRGLAKRGDETCDYESDLEDLPELAGRDDSDSDDDESDDESDDEDDFFDKPSYEKIRKSAPNRLVNVEKLKTVIEKNLTKCPVCKSQTRELCDGKTLGLEIEINYSLW